MSEDTEGSGASDRPSGDEGWASAVVSAMHDGAIAVDAHRRIAFVNDAVVAATGVDREDLLGAPLERLLAAELIDRTGLNRIRTATDRVLEQGAEVATCEVTFEPGAEDRTLEIVWAPVEGPVTGAVGTVRDVTHRVSIGHELRERRRTIERLHDAAAEIVACETVEDVCERTVAAAEEILGFGRCALALQTDGVLSPVAVSSETDESGLAARSPDAWAADRRACQSDGGALLPGDRSSGIDATGIDAPDPDVGPEAGAGATDAEETRTDAGADDGSDGTVRGGSALAVPVGDLGVFRVEASDPGAFDERDVEHLELLVAYVAETLRRIDVEEELRERERALVEERDRLAALFENVPDPVVAYEFHDGAPIVRDVNGPFEETFGYEREAVRGENVDEYLVPAGAESEADRLNDQLQDGERLRTTAQRRTADGLRDFLLNVVPIEADERDVEGFAIYTDITEQKTHQRELERRNERLEEFASIVSHDLRNPLSVADGFFELAVESGEEAHVERVRRAHRRMDTMIDELLSLAREGNLVGETEPVDLEAATTRAWATVDTPDATLSVPESRRLEADDDRLVELLENCFRNAVEHAGGDVDVTVTATEEGFAVADDGPGIPETERDRVFESGFTTRASGTGFGLSIVDQIAAGHDWDVEVGESEDGGARFHFVVED